MPQVPNFYLDFQVTGSERKRLVQAISEHIGDDPHYLGAPSFAYQVDYFTIDRAGCVSFDSRADSEEIEGLLEALANQGFVSVSSNFRMPEEETEVEASQETAPESEPRDADALNAEAEDTAEASETVETTSVAEPQPSLEAEENAEPDGTVDVKITFDLVDEAPAEAVSDAPDPAELSADIVARLTSLRTSLIREIDRQFDGFLRTSNATAPRARVVQFPLQRAAGAAMAPGETAAISLCGNISTLRGTKPVLVKYGSDAIPATSWKQVVGVILDICNRQEVYHQALLEARNTVAGRGRKFLSDSPQGMYSPLKIDEGLYMESNFSTEALLKLLRDRILGTLGFDSSGITLEYRRP